jgi:hypothetical protein
MGTSSAFGGQGGGTPLVPSWLDDEIGPASPHSNDGDVPVDGTQPVDPLTPQQSPPIPPLGEARRFSTARSNFTRFAKSGGQDRASLGRAISQYVSHSTGGARAASARMGSSRRASANLLGFLSDAVNRGSGEALRALNLSELSGQPIERVFLGLADYLCPDGGSIDEGITREAFIETIADLAEAGVTDLDHLTTDQMVTVFELFVTNAIEARLCNDIGANTITFPADARAAAHVQVQLHDFIRRSVADALASATLPGQSLRYDRVLGFVDQIYAQTFEILRTMGETEAQAA